MINNPYEVLGLKPGASQAEIKAAYKELVKKYHPDKYINNPLADLAKEKMQEINEAYDYLTKNNAGQGAGGGTAYGGTNGYSTGSAGNGIRYQDVRMALDRNDLDGAEQLLINKGERGAEWFFLSGILSYKKGWIDDAMSNVTQAVEMDPNNAEYRQAYSQMMTAGMMYRNRSNGQGYNQAGVDPCLPLCCCSPCCC